MRKIDKKDIADILALSPMQEGMLFHYLKEPRSDYYFEQLSFRVSGDIDVDIFKKAWNAVIQTNEMLRTFFRWEQLDRPTQVILKEHTLNLAYHDLSTAEKNENLAEKKGRVEKIKLQDREEKFDLRDVPLRVRLCKVSRSNYYVIISNHHILYDGWSAGIILKEFFRAYHALDKGEQWQARRHKPMYKEFIKWLQKRNRDKQVKFWENYFQGFDTQKGLPIKRLNSKPAGVPVRNYRFILLKGMMDKLEIFIKSRRVTLATFLYCGWGMLLQRYGNACDVIFGTTVSGRSTPIKGIENMVGLLINTPPLRIKTKPGQKVLDLLYKVNDSLVTRENYEHTPLVEIKRASRLETGAELFDSILVLENYPLEHFLEEENSTMPLGIHSFSMIESTNYDLTVTVSFFEEIEVCFIYKDGLFETDSIKSLALHFCNILQDILDNPGKAVHEINLLSEEEKHKLLAAFNKTNADYPKDKTIHQLFEEQVEKSPDNIAVISTAARMLHESPQQLSYHQLNKESNQLAYSLKEKGVLSDGIVGIMVERSVGMVIGILGILKAGGAYLPIDPDYPRERMEYMLTDCAARVLVRNVNEVMGVSSLSWNSSLERGAPSVAGKGGGGERLNPRFAAKPDNLAYVIYTSGSTGKPKGVMVSHLSIVNLLMALHRRYPLTKQDTYLLKTSYLFDVSVTELFGWFLAGGKLAVLERGGEKDPRMIIDTIACTGVTHINFVPSMFNAFVEILNPRNINQLSGLKYLFLAGEALPPLTVKRFRHLNNNIVLENIYGPTEAAVYASWYSLAHWNGEGPVPIGKPLSNVTLYIFSKWWHLQPVEVPGELCISGDGLARGYLNRPQLTAEKFDHDLWDYQDDQDEKQKARIQNDYWSHRSYSSYKSYVSREEQKASGKNYIQSCSHAAMPSPHHPIYQTGDLARWLGDGNIEFLGRMDHQVKVRGFRIELEEIEIQLSNHESVKSAVVVAKEDGKGDKYLCAYIVEAGASKAAPDIGAFKKYLSRHLPDYMIPTYFVNIDRIPLTTSGKVDRKALPEPEIKSQKDYVAPGNEKEKVLVNIWAEVLGIDKKRIGIEDNFFELGGHSLKIVGLVGRIHKELNIELPFSQIFDMPTVRELAQYISIKKEIKCREILPVEKKEYYLLSSAQRRLFVLQQLDAGSTTYNISGVMALEGGVEKEKLEYVFRRFIQRHESLRTSFFIKGGQPIQRIHPNVVLELEYFDLNRNQVEVKVEENEGTGGLAPLPIEPAAAVIKNFIRHFDLSRAPLLRTGLIRIGESKSILIVDIHHIISDGVSMDVLLREFISLYAGEELPSLKIQYKDFSKWQNSKEVREAVRRQENYWFKEFADEAPLLNLPTDYTRPALQSFKGAVKNFELGLEESKRLKTFALEEEATLFMAIFALYYVFLAKISNQEDIVIGTPVIGRRHADLGQVVGMFVNSMAVRNYPVGRKRFRQFLREVKSKVLETFENQDYPFEELVEAIAVKRDKGRNPLFDTMFSLANPETPDNEKFDLKIFPYDYENNTAKFDLCLSGSEVEEILLFELEYCTALFKENTLSRFIRYFKNMIFSVLNNPGIKISKIEILSDEEKHQLLHKFQALKRDFPEDKPVHRLFEDQAEKSPTATALVLPDDKVSYQKLNELSNRFAHYLESNYRVLPDDPVGLPMETSGPMLIALLGILKTGGAYIPLHPDTPPWRLKYILTDSNCKLLITGKCDHSHPVVFEDISVPLLEIGDVIEITGGFSPGNFSPVTGLKDIAYISYRSDSSGFPRGTAVEHRGLLNSVQGFKAAFDYKPEWGYVLSSLFSVDSFLQELFIPLTLGAQLHVVENPSDISSFASYIIEHEIHVLQGTSHRWESLLHEIERLGYPHQGHLSGLKLIAIRGGQLTAELCGSLQEVFPRALLVNMYGTAGCSLNALHYKIEGKGKELSVPGTPIGKGFFNSTVHILNSCNQLSPIGIDGEICIGGVSAARGYLNDPEANSKKFVRNPFAKVSPAQEPATLYRTGDIGRYLPDGNVVFTGSKDGHIALNGCRIESNEIRFHLMACEGIKEAVVGLARNSIGEEALTAYYVKASDGIDIFELKKFLSRRLPVEMIPLNFIELDKLPLTTKGQLDRRALPQPFIEARSEIEEKLSAVWSKILGIKPIGVTSDFFQLGGNSIKALMLVAEINEAFKVNLSITDIFEFMTIERLGGYLSSLSGDSLTSAGIKKIEKQEYYELSHAQRRLWVLCRFPESSIAYNIPSAHILKGKLDEDALARAFDMVVQRHESLRTVFITVEDKPKQKILNQEKIDFKFEKLDYRKALDVNEEEKLSVLAGEETRRVFDLSKGPLVIARLTRLEDERYFFLLNIHHIISDGWSMGILVREIGLWYHDAAPGGDDSLPPLKIQYKDFSLWQNRQLRGEAYIIYREYWLARFSEGTPVLELPCDYPRPRVKTYNGDRVHFSISPGLSMDIEDLGLLHAASLFITLLATVKVLLYRYTGQEDIVVGSPIAGRGRSELENQVGFYVNTLALRTGFSGSDGFEDLLMRVKQTALAAYAHDVYPFDQLVDDLDLARDTSRFPLFDVVVALNPEIGDSPTRGFEGITIENSELDAKISKFDLLFIFTESDENIYGNIEFNTDLFSRNRIERMCTHYLGLLDTIISHSDRPLDKLDYLSAKEKHQLLVEFNDTKADYPKDKTIHELFEEQVDQTPYGIASVGPTLQTGLKVRAPFNVSLSYKELNETANRLGHFLRSKGVGPDIIVGIILDRSLEMIASIIGILKAGGTYLPIDPDYPGHRAAFILEDCGSPILMTQNHWNDKPFVSSIFLPELQRAPGAAKGLAGLASVPGSGGYNRTFDREPVFLDEMSHLLSKQPAKNPGNLNQREDTAYIIYTSGTTGRPKGVMIQHGNVVRLMKNSKNPYNFTSNDTWTMFHSYCFDFSVWEMYGALLYGGKLVIIPKITARDTKRFLKRLRDEKVTILNQTPPAFYQLIEEEVIREKEPLLALRYIIFGGEALSPAKLRRWKDKYPNTRLINMFGITETTVHVTFKELTELDIALDISNIGKPIPTLQTYIIDKNLRLLPLGVAGELCITGDGVARGYLNRPELTAEKFCLRRTRGAGTSPISHHLLPLYRSGDLARLMENGDMIYLGRIDTQVKVRGHRIELGEIKNRLLNHNDVKDAVLSCREDKQGDRYLCAYLVPEPGTRGCNAKELKQYLAVQLPDYMVPSYFVPVDKIPLTTNGKVNWRALPEPRVESSSEYAAPGNEIEEKLAGIYQEILNVEKVGIRDSFFELGGNSLKAVQLISRIRVVLKNEMDLQDIFLNPSIVELAEKVKNPDMTQEIIEAIPRHQPLPLSFSQTRLWFLDQLNPGTSAYNMPFIINLGGDLNVEGLKKSFDEIVKRHEILRTVFYVSDIGLPFQRVTPHLPDYFSFLDLSHHDPHTLEPESRRIVDNEVKYSFDLGKGPLMKLTLLKISDQWFKLVLVMHHIISDGWSMGVIMRELMALYNGTPSSLKELKIQYADFAYWQKNQLKGDILRKLSFYWKEKLKNCHTDFPIPTDYPRGRFQLADGASEQFRLSNEISGALKRMSREKGVSLFMILITGLNVLLHLYSGGTDILVGTFSANRNLSEIEPLVGYFLNTLVLRTDLSGDPDLEQLLANVKETTLEAFNHQELPFELLLQELNPTRDRNRTAMFQVLFVLQNLDYDSFQLKELTITPDVVSKETAHFDLAFFMEETGNGIDGILKYNMALFKPGTIKKIITHYQSALTWVVDEPESKLATLRKRFSGTQK